MMIPEKHESAPVSAYLTKPVNAIINAYTLILLLWPRGRASVACMIGRGFEANSNTSFSLSLFFFFIKYCFAII